MSWSTRFVFLNLCVGFSIFNSVSPLLKFIFLFNKTQFKDQNPDFSFGSIFFQVKIEMNNFFGWVYEIRPRMKIYEISYEIMILIWDSNLWDNLCHCNGTRTHDHLVCKRTLKQLPTWLNSWVFFYRLSDCGFESYCSHLNFRFAPVWNKDILDILGDAWHSGNYRVWIHTETRTWHDDNIQSILSLTLCRCLLLAWKKVHLKVKGFILQLHINFARIQTL